MSFYESLPMGDWEEMGALIDISHSHTSGPSISIPIGATSKVQILCSQAYMTGQMTAALDKDIEGTQTADFESDSQRNVVEKFFSLGLKAGSILKLPKKSIESVDGMRPDAFIGDKSDFWTFFGQLLQCFAANPKMFSTKQAKIAFAASILQDDASNWIQHYYDKTSGSFVFASFVEFMIQLYATFSNEEILDRNPAWAR
ncbi:hypothetical protein OnM2_077070 [Erysiphe neolycopersici]|uniref:DUF4939 domain-containing protein n=1 Tax=Erysiphe neolycopersici TaxID=212602 RepID=A0A420HHL8_9PEZI|nr:hypothetical protein OnM2_077070 [Erysiphe neolycopersici]